jgi:hypothetical protein
MNKYSTHYPTDFLPTGSSQPSQEQPFILPRAAIHLPKSSNSSFQKQQFIYQKTAIHPPKSFNSSSQEQQFVFLLLEVYLLTATNNPQITPIFIFTSSSITSSHHQQLIFPSPGR